MPPLPIIPDTYRCALKWDNGLGGNAVNVMHILKAGTSPSAVAAALDANATALMWTYMSANYVMKLLTITELDGSSASYQLATSGAKWSGQAAGDEIPAESSIVKLTTAFRGRSRRGRLFIGPVGEGVQAGGALTGGATLTNCQNAWNTWLAALIAAGFQPVVASYKLASQVPVTSILVEIEAGTQRRRQERRR